MLTVKKAILLEETSNPLSMETINFMIALLLWPIANHHTSFDLLCIDMLNAITLCVLDAFCILRYQTFLLFIVFIPSIARRMNLSLLRVLLVYCHKFQLAEKSCYWGMES